VVRDRNGRNRGRVFAAEEVIAGLARPFRMDLEIALEAARTALAIPPKLHSNSKHEVKMKNSTNSPRISIAPMMDGSDFLLRSMGY